MDDGVEGSTWPQTLVFAAIFCTFTNFECAVEIVWVGCGKWTTICAQTIVGAQNLVHLQLSSLRGQLLAPTTIPFLQGKQITLMWISLLTVPHPIGESSLKWMKFLREFIKMINCKGAKFSLQLSSLLINQTLEETQKNLHPGCLPTRKIDTPLTFLSLQPPITSTTLFFPISPSGIGVSFFRNGSNLSWSTFLRSKIARLLAKRKIASYWLYFGAFFMNFFF